MNDQKRQSWIRWLPRFSMRTGLILFLVLGTGLGLGARWIREVRERGDAQLALYAKPTTAIKSARTRLTVTYASEPQRSWFVRGARYWVHREYDRRIQSLRLIGDEPDEATAANISKVFSVDSVIVQGDVSEKWLSTVLTARGLRSVSLTGSLFDPVSNLELERLIPSAELQHLHIWSESPISSEFVEWLCRAPKLQKIDLSEIPTESLPSFAKARSMTEFSLNMHQVSYQHPMRSKPLPAQRRTSPKDILRLLSGLPTRTPPVRPVSENWRGSLVQLLAGLADHEQLRRLKLSSTVLEDADLLKKFCQKSRIQHLHLASCNLSPESLREIAKLNKLETLHLEYTPLAREHLEILATIKSLREIDGLWFGDLEAEEELRKALPQCKVTIMTMERIGDIRGL